MNAIEWIPVFKLPILQTLMHVSNFLATNSQMRQKVIYWLYTQQLL